MHKYPFVTTIARYTRRSVLPVSVAFIMLVSNFSSSAWRWTSGEVRLADFVLCFSASVNKSTIIATLQHISSS